ncbi:MAG TPA: tetratricopeptide repeat protein [Chryseosolibacter sp.]|nr:tetratricopeptide repeat protein [Chryseosolibacter sp.]
MTGLFLGACSESKETRVQRFLAQGNDMAQRRNYEQAVEYYKNALKLDSCFADAWNNLGTVYFQQRDFVNAETHYTRAIRCKPGYDLAHVNRANLYFETDEMYRALKDLGTVKQQNPDTVVVYLLEGLIYTKLRDYEKAEKAFVNAISLDNKNAELKINLGTVYYYQGKYDSARQLLNAVINETSEPNAYNTLALIETATGNYPAAMGWISKALAVRRNDAYYLNNRGYIYLMMNDYSKALSDINESILQDPYNGWAYRNKGIYYLKQSKAEDALKMFRQAVGLDPHIENIYYYLGEASWTMGMRVEACGFYRTSIAHKEAFRGNLAEKCAD